MPRLLSNPRSALLLAVLFAGTATAQATNARQWVVTLTEKDGTQLAALMTFERSGDQWELYSRPGAVNELINWRQRVLGTLLRKLPPHGALVNARGAATTVGDSVLLDGTIESEFLGRRSFRGSIRSGRLRADLRWTINDTITVVGTIDGTPAMNDAPLRDYRAVTANAQRAITDLVYDPAIPRRPNFEEFFRQFDEAGARAHDDLDLVGSFIALKPLLGISHFEFIRNPKIAVTPLDSLLAGDPSVDPSKLVTWQTYGQGAVGYLYVRRWDRVTPYVERAFERMDSAKTKVMILDIRGNRGGDATSMVPLMHLFRDTTYVGGFVGRPWYAAHDRPPTDAELRRFPVMTNETEAKSLLDHVRTEGGTYGRLPPRAPRFDGPVFLLIDGNSGSASEPLAHVLKSTHRATVIGERTPGAMLTALPHPLGEGFIMTIPEADYYAADGTRLEGHGVEPDIFAKQGGEALIVVGREIQKIEPYGGTVWLANSYTTLQRYDDAERAWKEALTMAPSEAAKTFIQARIDAVRKLRAP